MAIKFIGRSIDFQEVELDFSTAAHFALFLLLHHLHSQSLKPQPERALRLAVTDSKGEHFQEMTFNNMYEMLTAILARNSDEGYFNFYSEVPFGNALHIGEWQLGEVKGEKKVKELK